VVARISGSQSARAARTAAGIYLHDQRAADDDAPAIMMMNTAGPSPVSMKA